MSTSLFICDVTRWASQRAVDAVYWHGVGVVWGILRAWIHQMRSGRVPVKVT